MCKMCSAGMVVALGFFAMAWLRRRQAEQQREEIEHAILKKLSMPTLEELDGQLPEGDPFADGADNTEGMEIREKQQFLGCCRIMSACILSLSQPASHRTQTHMRLLKRL